MTIPDFTGIDLGTAGPSDPADWEDLLRSETGRDAGDLVWNTPEQIPVRPLSTAADRDGLDFVDTWPGLAPFLRGPYPTMYASRPWTIRQYAGLDRKSVV
jgi:methylmalonyl-CoA mutase